MSLAHAGQSFPFAGNAHQPFGEPDVAVVAGGFVVVSARHVALLVEVCYSGVREGGGGLFEGVFCEEEDPEGEGAAESAGEDAAGSSCAGGVFGGRGVR